MKKTREVAEAEPVGAGRAGGGVPGRLGGRRGAHS